jgi:hypothetical protein
MSEDGSASEFPFTSYLNLEKKKEKRKKIWLSCGKKL